MAAALAYYTTFSLAPLLLIVVGIAGVVFHHRESVLHQIQRQVEYLVGSDAARQVASMVESASRHSSHSVPSAVLGFIAVLVGATGAFGQLQSSLNQIWKVMPDPRVGGFRNFIGQRILSFGMILAIAFLLLVSLVVTAAIEAFSSFISPYLPNWVTGPMLVALGFFVSFLVVTAMFASMYKILPDAEIRWRDVWFGAAVTSLLFTVGKFLIGAYLGHSGAADAYGAAGSLVLLVLWVYYSSMIFLIGAEFTAIWSERCSGAVRPKHGAVCARPRPQFEAAPLLHHR